jgi:hypothetical protein
VWARHRRKTSFELADRFHALKWRISCLTRHLEHSCIPFLTACRRPRPYPTSNIPSTASRRRPLNCGTVSRCAKTPASSTFRRSGHIPAEPCGHFTIRNDCHHDEDMTLMYPYNVPATPSPSRTAIQHLLPQHRSPTRTTARPI